VQRHAETHRQARHVKTRLAVRRSRRARDRLATRSSAIYGRSSGPMIDSGLGTVGVSAGFAVD